MGEIPNKPKPNPTPERRATDGKEAVNHPEHYGGEDNPYEVIKVIEAWKLPFNLGTMIRYIPRAGKKDPTKHIEDLQKAAWYLNREIQNLKIKEHESNT